VLKGCSQGSNKPLLLLLRVVFGQRQGESDGSSDRNSSHGNGNLFFSERKRMVDVNILCCVIVVMELGLGRERGQMHIFLNIVDHLLGALVGKTKPFFLAL
jgi:hypothetical protein